MQAATLRDDQPAAARRISRGSVSNPRSFGQPPLAVITRPTAVYAPNSYGGPQADPSRTAEALWHADGEMVRAAYTLHAADDDWGQAGTLVRDVMDDAARERLVSNVAGHLRNGCPKRSWSAPSSTGRTSTKNLATASRPPCGTDRPNRQSRQRGGCARPHTTAGWPLGRKWPGEAVLALVSTAGSCAESVPVGLR